LADVLETPTPPLAFDSASKLMDELETMVEGLYLDSAAVFQPKGVPSTSNALRVKQEHGGKMFEITATNTLPCSMEEAGAMFWRDILTIRQYKDKSYRFVSASSACLRRTELTAHSRLFFSYPRAASASRLPSRGASTGQFRARLA
jgi:hypothetical protein